MIERVCAEPDCGRPHRARGLCHNHYSVARRAGTLPQLPTRTERFWARVEKTSSCWLWRGGTNNQGYGGFHVGGGKYERAHRVAWELLRGPIPSGLVIDHICRVRNCVNPDHLEPVAPGVNTLRGISFTAIYARATHCKNGHEFTPENTKVTEIQRICRECRREINRRYRARRRGITV